MGQTSVALALLGFLGAALQVATPPSAEPQHGKYAGDAACLPCHQEQSNSLCAHRAPPDISAGK
jgi:hypothetical protein